MQKHKMNKYTNPKKMNFRKTVLVSGKEWIKSQQTSSSVAQ